MAFLALELFTFIMFFQPVYVWPWLEPYSPYRYSAILALLLFLAVGQKAKVNFLKVHNARYFLLFIAMQGLSAAAIWLHGAIDILNLWKNLLIIYMLIVLSCTEEKHFRQLMLMIVGGILYLSYYSITHFIRNYEPGLLAKGFGWYENGNDLVLILTCVIPLALCLAETSKLVVSKYLYILIAALFAFNILITGSREGLLGLTSVGIICLMFSSKISRIIRIGLFALLIGSIISIGIATVMTRSDLAGRFSGDESSENRILQWKACIRMTLHHPILGIGPNEARFRARDYGGVRGLMPHNTLVQVFAETGIPGGIFFVMCTIYPLWEAWKFFKIKENRNRMQETSVIIYKYLVIALSGFWICAFFSNRVYFKILYVLIALISAIRINILDKQVEFSNE